MNYSILYNTCMNQSLQSFRLTFAAFWPKLNTKKGNRMNRKEKVNAPIFYLS